MTKALEPDDMHLVAEPSSAPWNIVLKTDDGTQVGILSLTHIRLCWPEHCPSDQLKAFEHRTVRDWLVGRINGGARA